MAVTLIGIDWGTTTARAYRFDARGTVVAEHSSPLGVQKVEAGRFRAALEDLLGGGIPDTPLIACGMIGSRQGWLEVPYLECPAELPALAGALVTIRDAAIAIVPGLICSDSDGVPDVMRGEETQILGVWEPLAGWRQVIVLPGTHSKWALASGSGIETFATFMTGELYAVLREHSILGRLAAAGTDAGAFERGVRSSLRSGAALPHDLFSARTLALTGMLASEGVPDYLSGLLLGAELAAAQGWLQGHGAQALPMTLVGEAILCERYRRALAIAGIDAAIGRGDAAARGLWRIARQAHMV